MQILQQALQVRDESSVHLLYLKLAYIVFLILGASSMFNDTREPIPRRNPSHAAGTDVGNPLVDGEPSLSFYSPGLLPIGLEDPALAPFGA